MPPKHSPIPVNFECRPHLLCLDVASLPAKNRTAFARFQRLDDSLADFQLSVPAEKMQEASNIYGVDLAL